MTEIIKDRKRIFIGEEITENYYQTTYLTTAKRPRLVVKPIDVEEVKQIVKYAYDNAIPVIARGAGTGAVGSQIPVTGDEIVIDMQALNKIISFDAETLTLTVESGVTLQEVREEALRLGYFYPPDPGAKISTIGGNVATNAGGMKAVKYGTTRNYVKSLEVVLANGSLVNLGELTVKNSSGYNLKDLFIGSEGTLGITTKVKLKLIKAPLFQKSILLAFSSLNEATKSVLEILNQAYEPQALEMFDKKTISYSEKYLNRKFLTKKGEAFILMILDSNNETHLALTIERLVEEFKRDALEIIILDEAAAKLAWQMRDSILYALMDFTKYEMLDEVVPLNKFAQMIAYTNELSVKHHTTILNFGHAGDGNIHTILLQEDYSDEVWQEKRIQILDDLYLKVKELGGLVSAEHGIGQTKKNYFLKLTDPVKIELMRAIKKALDPKNILNPFKII
ncbi:MAG: FAD-binding oxidoreductase [Acholeplasmataceae bacterium]|jgi:glycolate oxidase|nr:FAD-binding oxidoreductase [Acholeplasmataceae bacterium]